MSIVESISATRSVKRLSVTCSFKRKIQRRLHVDVTLDGFGATLDLIPKYPIDHIWQLLAYEYSIVRSLSTNQFLRAGLLNERLWENLRLWEEVFKDVIPTTDRTGIITSIVFCPPETMDRVTFVYDENLQFVRRRPIGSMTRLPDRDWRLDSFLRPCIIIRRDQHYYFVPELEKAVNLWLWVKEVPLQYQMRLTRVWRRSK